MANQEQLNSLILERIQDLEISSNLSDLHGRAIVLYNPTTGVALGFDGLYALLNKINELEQEIAALKEQSIVHISEEEWESMESEGEVRPRTTYMVYADDARTMLIKIYVGNELVAQKLHEGSNAFPLAFTFKF